MVNTIVAWSPAVELPVGVMLLGRLVVCPPWKMTGVAGCPLRVICASEGSLVVAPVARARSETICPGKSYPRESVPSRNAVPFSTTLESLRRMVSTGGSSANASWMPPPIWAPPSMAVSASVSGGRYRSPGRCGALTASVPFDCPAVMVMVALPPAPWMSPLVISWPPHSRVIVWSVSNRTLLVIETLAVAEAPPSVSSVTALPLEPVRVSPHSATSSSTTVMTISPLVPGT